MVQRVLDLYSRLVDYPRKSLVQDVQSLVQRVMAPHSSKSIVEPLERFKKAVETISLTEMQETYTRTFDLSPVCSPHVGFHLFGESYKRGSLMANLKQEYKLYGLLEGSEIPDHLSLILKYASILSTIKKERELFKELLSLCLIPGLEKMEASFDETTNPYRDLLQSLSAWLTEQAKEVNPHV